MKHRPGPWRIAASDYKKGLYYIHGKDASSASRELQIIKIDYGEHPIKEHLDAAKEVAKLIAAAPELLEALKAILELGRKDTSNIKYDQYYENAEAAIKKATS